MALNKIKIFFRKIYFITVGRQRVENLIKKKICNEGSMLDAGCGKSSPITRVRGNFHKVGLDIYEPYLLKCREQSMYDDYVLGDVRDLPFKSNFFDYVMSIEVLEHLNKLDGLKMIKEMTRVAKKKIILTTPNGFLSTFAGAEDNPTECHLSGWTYNELKELGLKVYGLNGLKFLWTIKKGRAVYVLNIPILSTLLVDLSEFIVYYFPKLAFQFFCVKNLDYNNKTK